jgi:glycerophosphoryl diester phosphodiesterase
LFEFSINTIVGHRGCNEFKYSNTIEAFLKGVELGAGMIEFDVRRTGDGVLIIHHDEDVFGNNIKDYNYEFLKTHAFEKGLQIPTLEETLDILQRKTKLVVELKEKGYEEEVMSKIKEYFNDDEFVVISFYEEVIKNIKEKCPDVIAGLLLGYEYSELKILNPRINHLCLLIERYKELFPWKSVKNCKADFIATHFELLHLGLLKSAFKKNIPVCVWTVNNERMIKKLIKGSLTSGIISDKPGLVRNSKKYYHQ